MLWLQHHFTFYLITVAIVSLLIGSFVNTVIYRLPTMLMQAWRQQCYDFLQQKPADATSQTKTFNLLLPRSHCPHCSRTLPWWCNIPVISFLLLKGRCYFCHQTISWQYPFIEIITLLLSVITAWQFGVSVTSFAAMFLTWCLIALAGIDLNTQILPDIILLPLIWLGLLLNAQHGFVSAETAIYGAVIGYLSLWSLNHLFRFLRGFDGMGYGDFKLFALFGAWLGWFQLIFIVFIAAFLGSLTVVLLMIFKGHDRHIPISFGPFLAVAGWINLLYGSTLITLYWQWFIS